MGPNLPEKEGFKEPYRYPKPRFKIYSMATILLLSSSGLMWSEWDVIRQNGWKSFALSYAVLLTVTAILNLRPHEWIHYVVSKLHGYEPKITVPWHHVYAFVNSPDQFIDANHNVINLLSPLFVLNTFYLIVVIWDPHWAVTLVTTFLFINNTYGSAADLYGAYFDYNLPRNSLVFYPKNGGNVSYIFEPNR